MQVLQLASCMAENTEALCRAVAEIIEIELGIPAEYVSGIPWQERERLFDLGEIQILWLCGLPYVRKADLPTAAWNCSLCRCRRGRGGTGSTG